MSPPDYLVALTAFADILECNQITYHVGGSIASSAWGRGRSTADVDLVAIVQPSDVPMIVRSAKADFYIDDEMIYDAIRRRRSFNVVHLDTMTKIDVFIPKDSSYDREAFARTRHATLDVSSSRTFPLASPEDIVLRKLAWYRLGGQTSERQWRDVVDLLRVQHGQIDVAWMKMWARDLNVEDLLDRALDEADTS